MLEPKEKRSERTGYQDKNKQESSTYNLKTILSYFVGAATLVFMFKVLLDYMESYSGSGALVVKNDEMTNSFNELISSIVPAQPDVPEYQWWDVLADTGEGLSNEGVAHSLNKGGAEVVDPVDSMPKNFQYRRPARGTAYTTSIGTAYTTVLGTETTAPYIPPSIVVASPIKPNYNFYINLQRSLFPSLTGPIYSVTISQNENPAPSWVYKDLSCVGSGVMISGRPLRFNDPGNAWQEMLINVTASDNYGNSGHVAVIFPWETNKIVAAQNWELITTYRRGDPYRELPFLSARPTSSGVGPTLRAVYNYTGPCYFPDKSLPHASAATVYDEGEQGRKVYVVSGSAELSSTVHTDFNNIINLLKCYPPNPQDSQNITGAVTVSDGVNLPERLPFILECRDCGSSPSNNTTETQSTASLPGGLGALVTGSAAQATRTEMVVTGVATGVPALLVGAVIGAGLFSIRDKAGRGVVQPTDEENGTDVTALTQRAEETRPIVERGQVERGQSEQQQEHEYSSYYSYYS